MNPSTDLLAHAVIGGFVGGLLLRWFVATLIRVFHDTGYSRRGGV